MWHQGGTTSHPAPPSGWQLVPAIRNFLVTPPIVRWAGAFRRPRAAALLHARAAGASMSAQQVCASRGACAPLHLPHALFCVLLNTHRSLPATHRGPPGKSVKVPVAKIAGQLVSMPGVGVVDISVSVRRKGAAERVRAWCCALTHMPPRPRRVRCNQSCRPPAAASPRPDARLAQCSPPLRLR